jgi:DNA-binding SARP family transcriptional activator
LQFNAHEVLDSWDLVNLEKKAAMLLEDNGQPEEAFELLKKAEAWSEAVQLILKHAPNLAGQGRGQTLGGWIKALPKEDVESEPWLLYWKGVCLLTISPPESHALFRNAFNLFRAGRDMVGIFLSLSGLFDSITYSLGTYNPFDEELALFDEVSDEYPDFPSLEIEARLTANKLFAIVWRDLCHPDLKKTVERSLSILPMVHDHNVKMQLFQGLCYQSLILGEFQTARSLIDSVGGQIRSLDVLPHVKIVFKVTECIFYNFGAEFQKTKEVVKEGLDLASTTGMRLMDNLLLGHGATAALNSGDLEATDFFLQKMANHLARMSPHDRSFYYHLNWWKLFLEGEFPNSLFCEEFSLKSCLEAGAPYALAITRLCCALSLHELKRYDKAMNLLAESHAFASSARSPLYEFACFLIEAKFAFDKEEDSDGLIALSNALSIGRDKGYMNTPFFWIPAMMAELCQRALEAGIEVEYVRRLIRKRNLMPDPPPIDCEQWPWALKIFTLGGFAIVRNDEVVQFSGKIQKRPLEMLKILISNGGGELSEEYIADRLWPDATGDSAHSAFKMALSRLRRLLGVEGVLRFKEGKASLDPRYCRVDAQAFEKVLAQFEKRIEEDTARPEGEISMILQFAEKAVAMYKGHFLFEDEGKFWTISYRERLRSRFSRLITKVGDLLEKTGQWEKALEFYRKGIESDDLSEEFYQRLMICHRELGRRANAMEAYNHCKKLLSTKLGIEPSQKTKAIYKTL